MATPAADDADGILLRRLFYPGITKFVLAWFGFFESSLAATLYLFFMAVFLSVPSFISCRYDFHPDFEIKRMFAALFAVRIPIIFLLLSNMVSKLIFNIIANMTARDTILRFFMVDGDDPRFEQNVAIVKSFSREFSSEFQKRVSVTGYVMVFVFGEAMMDIVRLRQDFYGLCAVALWCYLLLSTVVANGVVYIASIACKLQLTIFNNLLNDPGNSISALFLHYKQLRNSLDKFSNNFRCYFATQHWVWRMSYPLAPQLFIPYFHGRRVYMLDTPQFVFLEAAECFLFWNTRLAFQNLSSEMAAIRTAVGERRELLPLNEESISQWEEIADYFKDEGKGDFTCHSSSTPAPILALCLGMVPLTITAISTLLGSTIVVVVLVLGTSPFWIRILTSLLVKLRSYFATP